jgi:hypothetical protein
MKKTFTLFTVIVLLLTLTVTADAADFSADGRLQLKYVDENQTSQDKYDALANLYAKINEEVTLTGVLKAKTGSNAYMDEVYGTYNKPFGQIKLGYFKYSTCGDTAILTNVIDDLQTDFGVSYSAPLKNGFVAKAYLGIGDDANNDNTYALTFGYAREAWGADINVVDSRLRDVYSESSIAISGDYAKTGFALNAFYIPLQPFRLYLNYETRDEDRKAQSFQYKDAILGATYQPIEKLTLIGEYNFEQNSQDSNNWGLRVNYKITPETTLSLIRSQETLFDYSKDQFTDSNYFEFRVQINF